MIYLYLLILLLNTSIFYKTIFNKKIEETLPITILTYILIIFITGIYNAMNIGFILILILNLCLFIINILNFIKRKNTKNIITPSLILFIISYLFLIIITYGKVASKWDEFSHWALVVKNMFTLDNFGLGSDSNLMFKTYLSGTSMFQYFCMKLNGTFNESILYLGMDTMIISFLVPIVSSIKTKNNFLQCILYFTIILIPTIFYDNIYSSVYVDGILGIVFAYSLYSYFNNRENKLNAFDITNLICSLTMLVFIKESGLLFAIITYIIILIDNLFIRNKLKLKNFWKNNRYLILSILPPLIVKIIWTLLLKVNNVESSATNSILDTTFNILKTNILPYQKETIKAFVKATFETNLTNSPIHFSYYLLFSVSIILGLITSNMTKKEENKSIKILNILIVLGYIGYALLVLLTYISVFSEYEATRLASFDRYMDSYALGVLIIQLAILIKELATNKQKLTIFIISLFAIFSFSINSETMLNVTIGSPADTINGLKIREEYNIYKNKITKYLNTNEKLYFISTNDSGFDYYVAKYEITPIKISPGAWSIGSPYDENDIWTKNKTKEEWKKELLENYDYVYLYDIDNEFKETYGELFENENIKDNQLYKVINTSYEYILTLVE